MSHQYIGTLDWARKTGGSLTLKDRLNLMRQVLAPSFAALARSWLRLDRPQVLTLEQIPQPDTAAIKNAYEELRSCADDTIINHSFRTYFWGAALGKISGVEHDPELLMTACLLHDLGMTATHHGQHPGCTCFAVDGALAARDWAARYGWPEEKQDVLAEAISLHMNGHVDVENGAEAHLLQQGAGCDVVGSRLGELGAAYRGAILKKYPRLGLNQAFIDFIARESALRPDSRSNLMRLAGFPLMVRTNPFGE